MSEKTPNKDLLILSAEPELVTIIQAARHNPVLLEIFKILADNSDSILMDKIKDDKKAEPQTEELPYISAKPTDLESAKTFAEKIKTLRHKISISLGKNYTQMDFAKDLNTGQSGVYKWETGKGFPRLASLAKIQKIAEKYGVTDNLNFNFGVLQNTFAQKIRLLRYKIGESLGKNYSQKDFAEELKLHKQAIYRWESGEGRPRFSYLISIQKIAQKYGIDLDFFNNEFPQNEGKTKASEEMIILDKPISHIAQKIKSLRYQIEKFLGKNYSQRDFAKDLGIRQSTLYRWEFNISIPRSIHLAKLIEIAKKYGVDFDITSREE